MQAEGGARAAQDASLRRQRTESRQPSRPPAARADRHAPRTYPRSYVGLRTLGISSWPFHGPRRPPATPGCPLRR